MQFARVVDAYEKIEATTKRLEMTELLVGLLRETPKEDLDKVVYLTQGRIHPDYEGIARDPAGSEVHRANGRRSDAAWNRGHDDRRRAGRRVRDESGSASGRARIQRLLGPRRGCTGPRVERHRRIGGHPSETLPPDPCDARGAARDARADLRANGEGGPRVQVRRLARAGPRIGKANRSLLPSSREYHGSISRDRGGPAIRNPGPRGDRRRRGRPGRSEHGGVPPVPGSQSPPRAQDGGRADGEGIPRHPVYIRLPPPFG